MRLRSLEFPAGTWAVLLIGLGPVTVSASDENPLFFAQAVLVHDSNLYRLSSAPRADQYLSLVAGAKARVFLGRQQVAIEAKASQNKFRQYDYLDHSGYDGKLNWLYQVGNSLSGAVGCGQKQTLTSLVDQSFGSKSLTTRLDCSAGLRISPTGLTTWGATLARMTNSYRLASSAGVDSEYNQDSFDTYLSRGLKGENQLQAYYTLRTIKQTDNALTTDDHRQHETGLRGSYRFGADTASTFRVGMLTREVTNAPQRNFSGLLGEVGGSWQVTADTSLSASLYRTVGAVFELNANDLVVDGLSLTGSWHATPKVELALKALAERRNYEDDPGLVPATLQRRDTFASAALTANYVLSRKGSLSATYSHEQRGSNVASARYQVDVLQLALFLAI